MVHTLELIQRASRRPVPYTIVPTLFDRRTRAARDSLDVLREAYPETLWEGVIPVDNRFREASKRGLPLSTIAPSSRGVRAYDGLLEYLMREEETSTTREEP